MKPSRQTLKDHGLIWENDIVTKLNEKIKTKVDNWREAITKGGFSLATATYELAVLVELIAFHIDLGMDESKLLLSREGLKSEFKKCEYAHKSVS